VPAKGDPGKYIAARLTPGDVVIDVGANEGVYAKQFAKAVAPNGYVLAFEPDPRCHDALHAINHGVVAVMRCAVGSSYGNLTFYQGRSSQQSSCIADAVPERAQEHGIVVEVVPLDSVCGGSVEAVKIDVQGGEAAVLRGAKQTLRRCPLWVIELWPWGLKQAGESPASVIDPFVEAGLVPRYLSDDDPDPTPADLVAYCEAVTAPHEHVNVAWVRP